MKAKKCRTEIKIETHQVKVIRLPRNRSTGFCRRCRKQVPLIAIEAAAEAMEVRPVELIGLVEANRIHLVETALRDQFICGDSLIR